MATKTKTQKSAVDRLAENAAEIHELEARLADKRNLRDTLMHDARGEGATWRTIAIASGLTEHGARKALLAAGLLEAKSA